MNFLRLGPRAPRQQQVVLGPGWGPGRAGSASHLRDGGAEGGSRVRLFVSPRRRQPRAPSAPARPAAALAQPFSVWGGVCGEGAFLAVAQVPALSPGETATAVPWVPRPGRHPSP